MLANYLAYARLVLETGAPYDRGACFHLQQKTVLGRSTDAFQPDIPFDSLLISRRHCCIEPGSEGWLIRELGSRHGTLLNGRQFVAHSQSRLKNGDKICLAGIVLLRFIVSPEWEKTLDFDRTQGMPVIADTSEKPFLIDMARRALRLEGMEVALSEKQWSLLELLYTNRNTLVSYEVVRSRVWPERCLLHNGVPDVGTEEINQLLHRLRQKLGRYGNRLTTRRGQGCLFEVD